jgi:hypothetical protein
MESVIETFEANWRFVRGRTYEFIDAVPDDRWEFSPHARYAPFHKQVRHMVCVQGVYNADLSDRVTDFGRKHTHYDGGLDRESLKAALEQKDAALAGSLPEIAAPGISTSRSTSTARRASPAT